MPKLRGQISRALIFRVRWSRWSAQNGCRTRGGSSFSSLSLFDGFSQCVYSWAWLLEAHAHQFQATTRYPYQFHFEFDELEKIAVYNFFTWLTWFCQRTMLTKELYNSLIIENPLYKNHWIKLDKRGPWLRAGYLALDQLVWISLWSKASTSCGVAMDKGFLGSCFDNCKDTLCLFPECGTSFK